MTQKNQVNKKSILTLKYFNLSLYGSIGILMTFFPLYFQTVGLSEVEIGLIMASGPFISILANPTWGYWSDRLQNLRLILIIMLLGNLFVVQFVFHFNAGSMIWVFTTMLIFFFFQTSLFSQSNTLILNAIEGTTHKFGSIRFWGSLGFAVMAVVAGPVLSLIGINNLWILYTILVLLTLAFCTQLPRGKVAKVKKINLGEYKEALLGNPYFLIFIIIGILISVPNSINQMFVSLYIDQMGGSVSMIGLAAFSSAFLEIPIFLLLDRYLKKTTPTMFGLLVIVSTLYVLRWVLMAWATDPIHIILIQSLHAVSFGGYFYIGTLLTAHLIPINMRASGQAIYAISWSGISGAVAGLIGGKMYRDLGPQTMYGLLAIMALLGAFGLFVLWQRIRKNEKFATIHKKKRNT